MPPLPPLQGAALIQCLLLLDVLANNGDGRTAAASGKVRWRPECSTPQFLADAGIILFADHAAGNPLEAIHQHRNGHGRRIIHQQMHMVILPVELHQSLHAGFPWPHGHRAPSSPGAGARAGPE